MATYIRLGKYAAQGIANIADAPDRLDAGREQMAELGVEIKSFYLTMGEYDMVVVVEAPDNATAAKALIGIGLQGNVSTTTMAGLTEHQFRNLLSEIGRPGAGGVTYS